MNRFTWNADFHSWKLCNTCGWDNLLFTWDKAGRRCCTCLEGISKVLKRSYDVMKYTDIQCVSLLFVHDRSILDDEMQWKLPIILFVVTVLSKKVLCRWATERALPYILFLVNYIYYIYYCLVNFNRFTWSITSVTII